MSARERKKNKNFKKAKNLNLSYFKKKKHKI